MHAIEREVRILRMYEPVRVFVGRDRSKSAVVDLTDPTGHTRARLLVDSLGSARLEFLDAGGHVVHAVPDSTRAR